MARPASLAYKHYQRVLSLWPKDPLRPTTQFQDLIIKRLESGSSAAASGNAVPAQEEMKQVNALYTLLDDRYKTKYPLKGDILKPKSQPTYFDDLLLELDEVQSRTFLGRIAKRLSGMIRFQ